jgi:hypothetical protein
MPFTDFAKRIKGGLEVFTDPIARKEAIEGIVLQAPKIPTPSQLLEKIEPTEKVGFRDAAREIPSTLEKGVNLFQDFVLRFPARAAGSITLGVLEEFRGKRQTLIPKNELERFFLGDAVLKSVQQRQEETKRSLSEFGISPDLAKGLSILGVSGMVGMDLLPFGGSRKTFAQQLLKTNKVQNVLELLRKAQVPDDVAKVYAPKFAATRKLLEVERGLKSLERVLGTTKPTAKTLRIIPQELEPLAQEARKYKSAEEFVNAKAPIPGIVDEIQLKENVAKAKANLKIYKQRGDVSGIKGETDYIKSRQAILDKRSQLIDFYNQTVRGVGGIPGIRGLKKVGLGPEVPRKIIKTEPQLLKSQLRAVARTSKVVATEIKREDIRALERFAAAAKREKARTVAKTREAILEKLRNTQRATEDIKKSITDFVKENLEPKDRGKANVLIRDAKTQKNLTKAFARISRWAEEATKNATRNDILKSYKSILDSPSIAIDYKTKIKELLGDFELQGHRETTLERLKKTQEFLKRETERGRDIEIPRRLLKSLEILNRTPYDQITLNQLTGLKAEMELLEDLGRTKFRTLEEIVEMQKEKIFREIASQGVEPVNNIPLIRPAIGERLTITQKARNLWINARNQAARIDKVIAPMDTIFDLLDGGKGIYNGANFRFFKGRVDAGYGRYLSRKDALQKPVTELATKYKLNDTNFERMGIVAAREQDKGIEKLIATGFTEQEINAVKLVKTEQEVLNLMRSTFDSQFPEIQDTMRKVYNQPVEKIKNYFSFMTDWRAMDDSEVFQRFGSQAPEQFGAPRKTVEVGFTKTRIGGEQKIKINALDVFIQHTDNTSYLLELGETSKILGEVAASSRYAELVGDVGQLMVREWVDVIARKGGAAGASQIAALDTLRKNVGIGILGLKLSTIGIQPTALIDGMGFIGVKYGSKGIRNFATDINWRKFILNMPEIKDRMGGEFALRELTADNWLQKAQRKGFIPMQTLDQLTAGSIATGAYERKMIELGKAIDLTKGYDKEALEYAQLAVRRTQSSGQFKDVPLAISRGALTGNRSLDRAMLQFQNFLLTRWSRIRHDAIRAGIKEKDPMKAVPIFTAIIMAALAGAGIRLGINKIIDFTTGKEDKDTITEDLTRGFVYEMTGNVPFLGTAVSMAMYDGEMFPILDAPKGVISGLNRVITSKSETAKLRGFTEFAGSTGALFGIPGSAQAEQLARGFLQEKKKFPTTPIESFNLDLENLDLELNLELQDLRL